MSPQVKFGGEPLLGGRQPELFQASDLGLEGRLVG
jgi:hypothetical protein